MGLFSKIKEALGLETEKGLGELVGKVKRTNTDHASDAPSFLTEGKLIARIEYPVGGDIDKMRLILSRGTTSTDEKQILGKLDDIASARCRTAQFVKYGKSSIHRDSVAIIGGQAALDARAMAEAGAVIQGYDKATNDTYAKAASQAPAKDFLQFLKSHSIPKPSLHKDGNGHYSMVVIPIIDPIIARGVKSYLEEIAAEHADGRAKIQQYVSQGIQGIEIGGEAVKYLQTLLTVDQYISKPDRAVERRPTNPSDDRRTGNAGGRGPN